MVAQKEQENTPSSAVLAGEIAGRELNNEPTFWGKLSNRLGLQKLTGLTENWNIQKKATALALLFGVVPVIVVGGVAYWIASSTLGQQLRQAKVSDSEQISRQLGLFLEERINSSRNLIDLINVTAPYLNPKEIRPTEKEDLQNALTQVSRNYIYFRNLTLYDIDGNPIIQARGATPESNQSKYTYFKKVIRTELPFVSDPILTDGEWVIYVAAPVKNKQGRTVGAVGTRIPVKLLKEEVLPDSTWRVGTTYYLIDSQGTIFEEIKVDNRGNLAAQELSVARKTNVGSEMSTLLSNYRDLRNNRESTVWRSLKLSGSPLMTYAPIENKIANLTWSLVTATDASVAFALQRQLAFTLVLGTLFTSVIAAILGTIIANRITRPIVDTALTVEKLERGQLDARMTVHGHDEIAILRRNINQMAARLQSSLSEIQSQAQRLARQNQVLAELAENESLILGDAKTAIQAMTEAVAHTLSLDQVTVWFYSPDGQTMTCLDRYLKTEERHEEGQAIRTTDFINSRNLKVESALTQTGTEQEYQASIYAYDVQIRIIGQHVATLSCEQLTTPRYWYPEERTFVSSIGNLIALGLENQTMQEEVGHILEVVSSMEDGDLSIQAQVSDRATGLVADLLNRLIEQLVGILTQVLNVAQQVSEGSMSLELIANTVADGANQQAQSVQGLLKLSEQVTTSAEDSAEQVENTRATLLALSGAVNDGQSAMINLTDGIQILRQGTDQIIQQMKTLGEFVGLANQFVQDQSEIAQRTQVLALNAALVAARASQQKDPRQFSLVAQEFERIAEEVGQLAQQTNEELEELERRTGQIYNVVSTIDTNVQSLGGLVGEFTGGVEQSRKVFERVQNVTVQTIEAGETVDKFAKMIVQASQSTVQAMQEIAQLAQRTAQLTQDSLIQSELMGDLSAQLLQRIQFFQLPNVQAETRLED